MAKSKFPSCFRIFPNYFIRNSELYSESPATGLLITINRLIWLDNGYKSEHAITQEKNHIPWNKNHMPPPRKPRGFCCQSYRSLTGKRQRHSERITCVRPLQWLQYFTFFLASFAGSGNMKKYSPTSIIFPTGVTLGEYDTLGWINFHISLTSMQ
jgi:hypothetical protein